MANNLDGLASDSLAWQMKPHLERWFFIYRFRFCSLQEWNRTEYNRIEEDLGEVKVEGEEEAIKTTSVLSFSYPHFYCSIFQFEISYYKGGPVLK